MRERVPTRTWVVSQANLLAFERYEPRAYAGPVVFVRAGERSA